MSYSSLLNEALGKLSMNINTDPICMVIWNGSANPMAFIKDTDSLEYIGNTIVILFMEAQLMNLLCKGGCTDIKFVEMVEV